MNQPQRAEMAFLPEAHTDFVFIVVPESRWFAVVLIFSGFLAVWLWRRARERGDE